MFDRQCKTYRWRTLKLRRQLGDKWRTGDLKGSSNVDRPLSRCLARPCLATHPCMFHTNQILTGFSTRESGAQKALCIRTEQSSDLHCSLAPSSRLGLRVVSEGTHSGRTDVLYVGCRPIVMYSSRQVQGSKWRKGEECTPDAHARQYTGGRASVCTRKLRRR